MPGVEGEVAGARLQHREQGRDQPDPARKGQRHHAAGTRAVPDEQTGQPVGVGVQVRVGDRDALAGHRGAPGRTGRLLLEAPGERGGHLVFGCRGVLGVLTRQQQVRVRQGRLGRGVGELPQQKQEPLEMQSEFGLVVHRRVGVEGEPQPGRVGSRAHRDLKVLDGAAGQVVGGGGMAGEHQVLGERDDVQHGPVHPPSAAQQPEIAAQELAPVLLVAAQVPQFGGDGVQQLADRGAAAVRTRSGSTSEAVPGVRSAALPSRAHRGQAQHQVVGAGHPVQIGGDGGDQQVGAGDARAGGGRGQGLGLGRGQVHGAAQEGRDGGGRPLGQPYRLGQAGQPLRPVGAVAYVALGGEVGRLLLLEPPDRFERGRGGLLTGGEGRVGVGEAARHQLVAVAVQQDVVGAQEPDVPVGGERQQRVREQRTRLDVHRRRQVTPDPLLGRGRRVGGRAHVHARAACSGQSAGASGAHRGRRGVRETEREGVGLGDGTAQRGLEQSGVDRPVDLHVLTGVVGGAAGGETLGEPEPLLRPGQRSTIVLLD